MATLSELQTRLDTLVALREGVQKRITHGDKTIELDFEAADSAIARLQRDISRASTARPARHARVRSFKDL